MPTGFGNWKRKPMLADNQESSRVGSSKFITWATLVLLLSTVGCQAFPDSSRHQVMRPPVQEPVRQPVYPYPATNAPSARVPLVAQAGTNPFGIPVTSGNPNNLGYQVQPTLVPATPANQQPFNVPGAIGQPGFQFPAPSQGFQTPNQPPAMSLPPVYSATPTQNYQAYPVPSQSTPVQGGLGYSVFPTQAQPLPMPPPMVPGNSLGLDVIVPQTTGTGKLKVGGTYGTDNGFVGQLIIDERDFSLRRFPRSFQDLFSPTVWRGDGQHFRLEVVPGEDLERYLVSLSFPYFRNTDWSLGLSAYYFDRQYFDWDEQRAGGRISLGRSLNEFLSVNASLRLENVEVDNPRLGTSPQLNADLGDHDLFVASVGLVYDDRLQQFMTTEGNYFGVNLSLGFGDFDYSRAEIDFRTHRMIYQRPDDFSGRHTVGYRTSLGFTGSDTPVFENFYGGGMTSLRGFDFRGVSPIDGGVRVGGEFKWLNSFEYLFPLTQDDMIYGTLFVDFGTVEESVKLDSDNFRVAPGFGLRVNLPFAGMGGAPFNIDFAFPVEDGVGDDKRTISFFFGAMR